MPIKRRVIVDHVGLLVTDLEQSRRLYRAALAPLGFTLLYEETTGCAFGADGIDDISLNQSDEPTTNAHIAFVAESRAAVDDFYREALANGAREKLAPSLHPEYHEGYYAAFVWDLHGNNIEAVFHDR